MKRLFRPIDIASVAFFRFVFGILAFADVMGVWMYKHFYMGSFDPDKFQFTYYGFEWVTPFPEPLMSLFFIGMLLLTVSIILGWYYHISCLLFAFGYTYIFLMEKSYYLNHAYLFSVLCFIMATLPANRAWSLDVLRKPSIRREQIPFWPLFLLRFCMGVVYFYGGIAKINMDWLNGMPLKLWLKQKSDMPILGDLWAQEWVAYFMSYGGLLLDLTVVAFLLNRRTRIWALAFVLFFHCTNLILFLIGIFPFLSTFMTLLFFAPDFPRRVFAWFSQRIKKLEQLPLWWDKKIELAIQNSHLSMAPPIYTPPNNRQKQWIFSLIAIFCFINLTLPLRHHYFDSKVAWTEEGHRYSWRMMLRSKRGYGHFRVVDLRTGELIARENGKKMLSKRQKHKMCTHPDMILQFAHHLKDKYQQEGRDSIAIYAYMKVKLNGRPYQNFIDPNVDLTQIEWSFLESSDWIVPFKDVDLPTTKKKKPKNQSGGE
ncbi:MAG: HTTM domain-containing protein [Bacteroidota bacterium]